jgi:DNA-binding transcriptional ArsR family regulator
MSQRIDDTTDGGPDDPEDLLPDHSILSFEEYMAMQRAIGNGTRFKILYRLKREGPMSASELTESLGIDGNSLHYHLNELVDVGVVENRKENTPDRDGLYSYYRATAIGEGLLEHGVEALMRREQVFRDAYGRNE